MIGGQQFVVVVPANLCRKRATEKVGDVGHRRTPGDRLPVHHGQVAQRSGPAEEHVVQSVVAVDQAVEATRLLGGVGVESLHQTPAHIALAGGDGVAVAIAETRIQRGDQLLVDRRLAVEPFGLRQGRAADQRGVQAAQLAQRQGGIGERGSADFITDLRRSGVVEQQGEEAGLRFMGAVVAVRDRSGSRTQPGCNLGIEPHFALIESQREAGLPTDRVGGGDLEHHRTRTPVAGLIVESDSVTLAHLPGPDALDGEAVDPARTDGDGQPVGREVPGSFDHGVGVRANSAQASRRCGCGSYSTWVCRSNTSTGRSTEL